MLIILYLPILMVIIYSFNSGRTIGSWQGFTTSWYSRLFSNALMADALKNSLILASSPPCWRAAWARWAPSGWPDPI